MVMIQPGDVCGGKRVYRSESFMILYCFVNRFGTEMIWPYLVKQLAYVYGQVTLVTFWSLWSF